MGNCNDKPLSDMIKTIDIEDIDLYYMTYNNNVNNIIDIYINTTKSSSKKSKKNDKDDENFFRINCECQLEYLDDKYINTKKETLNEIIDIIADLIEYLKILVILNFKFNSFYTYHEISTKMLFINNLMSKLNDKKYNDGEYNDKEYNDILKKYNNDYSKLLNGRKEYDIIEHSSTYPKNKIITRSVFELSLLNVYNKNNDKSIELLIKNINRKNNNINDKTVKEIQKYIKNRDYKLLSLKLLILIEKIFNNKNDSELINIYNNYNINFNINEYIEIINNKCKEHNNDFDAVYNDIEYQ